MQLDIEVSQLTFGIILRYHIKLQQEIINYHVWKDSLVLQQPTLTSSSPTKFKVHTVLLNSVLR